MKPTTESISNILKDESLVAALKSLADANPEQIHSDTTMNDSFERFLMLRDLILDAANSGVLDEMSHQRRTSILTVLNSINQQRNNWQQVISQTENLYDNVAISGLFLNKLSNNDFGKEYRELSKVKRSYSLYLSKLEESKKELEFIQKKKVELNDLFLLIEEDRGEIENLKEMSSSNLLEINSNAQIADEKLEKINEVRKEIESKQLSIDTFAENIEEYKTSINELEEKAKQVVSLDVKIKKLIDEAEKALQLNSSLGISAAFSAQHEAASDKKLYSGWRTGAISFLIISIVITVWTIGGWGIDKPDSINSILGRVVAVGISIAGAAFCAKQFVKQKNIAEDYAYKAVLSKSIIAFADEIAASDDDKGTQVGNYMNKVLDEIHKDPLRSRKEVSDTGLLSRKNVETIAKLINAAKGVN